MAVDLNPFDKDLTLLKTEAGYYVSAAVARIAEILKDYDDSLELCHVPESLRQPGDKPFAVMRTEANGQTTIVCYADECDERLISRIWSMDSQKHDIWTQLENDRMAREVIDQKRRLENLEEAMDVAQHILKSPKARYRHNGVVYE